MKAIITVILVILLTVGLVFLGGFIWMVCLGALSHIFDAKKLAIGFWPSVLVSVIASALLGGFRAGTKSK